MPNYSTIIAVNLAITAILGIFILMPKYQDYKNLERQVNETNTQLRDKENYYSDIENNSQELANYRDALMKVNSALPDDPFLPSLFRFLGNQASQSGLVMKEVRAGQVQSNPEGSNVIVVPVSISLSGTYPSFKSFLESVEKSSRLIEVENISIKPGQQKNLDFTLSIKTQYYSANAGK